MENNSFTPNFFNDKLGISQYGFSTQLICKISSIGLARLDGGRRRSNTMP
jgi:hypothetical protein